MFDGIKGVEQIALRAGQSITVTTTRHGTASAVEWFSFVLSLQGERTSISCVKINTSTV